MAVVYDAFGGRRKRTMGEYLLEVNHLSKYYKARGKGLAHANQLLRAVDDVSFKLRRGEVLGVVGCGGSFVQESRWS